MYIICDTEQSRNSIRRILSWLAENEDRAILSDSRINEDDWNDFIDATLVTAAEYEDADDALSDELDKFEEYEDYDNFEDNDDFKFDKK